MEALIAKIKSTINFKHSLFILLLVNLSNPAYAQYYLVYSAPLQIVYILVPAAPYCKSCRHSVKIHYLPKKNTSHSSSSDIFYRNNEFALGPPQAYTEAWQPEFNVTYGPPIYTPNTYHPSSEEDGNTNWDTRTADDLGF